MGGWVGTEFRGRVGTRVFPARIDATRVESVTRRAKISVRRGYMRQALGFRSDERLPRVGTNSCDRFYDEILPVLYLPAAISRRAERQVSVATSFVRTNVGIRGHSGNPA